MPRLPVISGRELARVLQQFGYERDHQTGSHLILRHMSEPHRRITVPDHRELAKGTLLAILRQAGLSREEFLKAYRGD